jgi:anti-sigma B factor antagonist
LSIENADALRREICKTLTPEIRSIELDFADTVFVDSYGLGALVSVYRTAARRQSQVSVRIKNPAPHILQLIELTRLHRLFEIQVAGCISGPQETEQTGIAPATVTA